MYSSIIQFLIIIVYSIFYIKNILVDSYFVIYFSHQCNFFLTDEYILNYKIYIQLFANKF
jgi:hypothetical protein